MSQPRFVTQSLMNSAYVGRAYVLLTETFLKTISLAREGPSDRPFPIHGDARKVGMSGLANGTPCELYCPVSGEPLTSVGEVEDGSGATYHAIYLSEKLSEGQLVMVSNIWGHYHSRVIDDMELISYWASTYAS